MNKNPSFPWWGVILGLGCVVVLCVGALGVGGFAYYYYQKASVPPSPEVVSPFLQVPTNQPIPINPPVVSGPTSSVIPEPPVFVNPEPTSSGPALTGNQKLDESYLYDDFSSEALGWPVYDDGKTIMKYENGQYGLHVIEPDYYDWAFVPVDFAPYEISFDAQGMTGQQNGTFGVFCHFRDEDNYYYVEFDLQNPAYVIGQFVNGEDLPLTSQNAQGQYWQDTSVLKSSSTVNRISVSCYPNVITLTINGDWVTEANVSVPSDKPGEVALFVYTYPFAGENGYKIYFDNVEVYKPVQ